MVDSVCGIFLQNVIEQSPHVVCSQESLLKYNRYIPNIKGSSEFQGELYHTAHWPHYDVSLKNKRIAVIGTGASGIQVIQEAGKHSKRLTVYQRTPNLW
jgi:thioredoxin reductase